MEGFAILGLSDQAFAAITICIVLMVLDVVTGFAGAVKEGEVSSTKIREGFFHKGGMVTCLILAWMLETATALIPQIDIAIPLLLPACIIVMLTEASSILENACVLNPNLSDSKLMKIFKLDSEE